VPHVSGLHVGSWVRSNRADESESLLWAAIYTFLRSNRVIDGSFLSSKASQEHPEPIPHLGFARAFVLFYCPISAGVFARVVVITTTLTRTNKVPTIVRTVSASPPKKYPTSTATIGFTYAYVPTFVGDS
jgi:hypothetical protein